MHIHFGIVGTFFAIQSLEISVECLATDVINSGLLIKKKSLQLRFYISKEQLLIKTISSQFSTPHYNDRPKLGLYKSGLLDHLLTVLNVALL